MEKESVDVNLNVTHVKKFLEDFLFEEFLSKLEF